MNLLLVSVKCEKPVGGIAVWTDHYMANCEKHDISCTLVNTEKVKAISPAFLGEIIRTRRIFADLNRALKNGSYDVAHLNTSCGPMGLFRDYFIAKRIRRCGIPVITHYHCDIPNWITSKLRRYVVQKLAKCSQQNFVLCENSHLFLEKLGVASIKVPNFVEDAVVATRPKEIRPTLNRIFFVGRISVAKGATEIYELAKRFPDKLFTLAGRFQPPVNTWETPCNLQLLGAIPYQRVLDTLDKADLFLFPSHTEGFSMALMEAMARGVPCLAFDGVGANSDMLAEDCGVTVPSQDVDAMETAIRNLEDPSLRQAISINAINKAKNHYTTDAVLSLFVRQYKTLF